MMDRFDIEAEREGRSVSRAFHSGDNGGRLSRHRISHHSPMVKRRPAATKKPAAKRKTLLERALEHFEQMEKKV